MLKLVAIGGGEIGRPGYPVETTKIDKDTIRLTGKKHPRLLFVGTASGDAPVYIETIKKYFGKNLGCKVSVLETIRCRGQTSNFKRGLTSKLMNKSKYLKDELEKIVLSTDIIYVGGGNTLKMLQMWKKVGLAQILKKAVDKGIVLSGVSAGANCWFKYSNSDSHKMIDPKKDYILLKCLGFVNAVMCPHYDVEKGRQKSLKKHMKNSKLVAVALGNCSALQVVGDKYRLLTSKKNAVGYKVYWKNGRYFRTKIDKGAEFKLLGNLLKK